jgi:hypothetical protein
MIKRFDHVDGLRISVEDGKVALHFIANNGAEVPLDALAISAHMEVTDAGIMLQWCADRVRDLRRYLPADELEKVELRMIQVAAQLSGNSDRQS